MRKFKKILDMINPVLISNRGISLSKRFILYQLVTNVAHKLHQDPFLNFVSLLKNYKLLEKILSGTLEEFYKDRKKFYFKHFFYDKELYKLVRADLEFLYPKYKDVKMAITKRGVIIYDNYKKNQFNVLLMTIHAGTWVPKQIEKKLAMTTLRRWRDEDVDTHKIYSNLVLEKGGIWIDNKQSRFVIDFNRGLDNAIYSNEGDPYCVDLGKVWKEELTPKEREEIETSYKNFYFTLSRLINTYRFNIIFDGHSMKDKDNRPELSFGTDYIPKFYLPIVRSMRTKLKRMGYEDVRLNDPYEGGYILKWLSTVYHDIFIFSMEVNKKLYMNKDRILKRQIKKLSEHITHIVDIEVDEWN